MHGLEEIRGREHDESIAAADAQLQETFLKKKNKLIRITLTKSELNSLQHIMWHFTDYMIGDDRPDHGLGILKKYKDLSKESRQDIYQLAGKLRRRYNKL